MAASAPCLASGAKANVGYLQSGETGFARERPSAPTGYANTAGDGERAQLLGITPRQLNDVEHGKVDPAVALLR